MSVLQTISNAAARILHRKTSATSSEAVTDSQFKPGEIPDKSDLELMYKLCPEVFSFVNLHSAMESNFQISTTSKEEQTILKNFYKTLSKTAFPAAFNNLIMRTITAADVFGLGPIERHTDDEGNFTISMIHPNSLEPKKTVNDEIEIDKETGMPKVWIQTTGNGLEKNELNADRLAFLRFYNFADEIYGTPIVQVQYNAGLGKQNTELGYAHAINRAGFPTKTFAVGDEKHEPSSAIMADLREKVKNFSGVGEFVHEYFIKPGVLENYSLPQARNYTMPFIKSMATAAMIPEAFIGGSMADLKYNSAPMLMEVISEASITPRRNTVTMFIMDEILFPLFEANGIPDFEARLVWQPPFPRSKQTMADVVKKLSETEVQEQDCFSRNELRELMGFKPMEDVKIEEGPTKKE